MDYSSKWPEVFTVPKQGGPTLADILVNNVFYKPGFLLELHSDQGSNSQSCSYKLYDLMRIYIKYERLDYILNPMAW